MMVTATRMWHHRRANLSLSLGVSAAAGGSSRSLMQNQTLLQTPYRSRGRRGRAQTQAVWPQAVLSAAAVPRQLRRQTRP